MECSRCHKETELRYRVSSDIIDMVVCADCAAEARELHIGVEELERGTTAGTDTRMRKAS